MIICNHAHPAYPDHWLIVKQSDHDDHCGLIAAHLNWARLWQPWDARLLTLASAMHDTGSAMWEDTPLINSTGEPWTFWTMPPDDHIFCLRVIDLNARAWSGACPNAPIRITTTFARRGMPHP